MMVMMMMMMMMMIIFVSFCDHIFLSFCFITGLLAFVSSPLFGKLSDKIGNNYYDDDNIIYDDDDDDDDDNHSYENQ